MFVATFSIGWFKNVCFCTDLKEYKIYGFVLLFVYCLFVETMIRIIFYQKVFVSKKN